MAEWQEPNLSYQEWSSQRGEDCEDVLLLVKMERHRQDRKWGVQDHTPLEWLSILTEEIGEVAQEINRMTWGGKGDKDYVYELSQVAAVAAAAIENLVRQKREQTGAV